MNPIHPNTHVRRGSGTLWACHSACAGMARDEDDGENANGVRREPHFLKGWRLMPVVHPCKVVNVVRINRKQDWAIPGDSKSMLKGMQNLPRWT